jgi:hypothetical protein
MRVLHGLPPVLAGFLGIVAGCAKPIQTELYSRTPDDGPAASTRPAATALRVGMGGDEAAVGAAFIAHAANRQAFASIGWARPENLHELDCQVECTLAFEHGGDSQVHYCLGRLVANIYNADHSRLLDRTVKFHEAMYTPHPRLAHLAHDGTEIEARLRSALFDELIAHLQPALQPPGRAQRP